MEYDGQSITIFDTGDRLIVKGKPLPERVILSNESDIYLLEFACNVHLKERKEEKQNG